MEKSHFKDLLQSYCAYQERCFSEVRQKLWDMDCPRKWHEELVMELIDEGFLNEERFAQSFVRGKFRMKGWGKLKIRKGLREKQVASRLIDIALGEAVDPKEYLEKAIEVGEKKWRMTGGDDSFAKWEKVKRYLYSRGFEWETIGEVRERLLGE